jgi:cellobiose dehydrogenase (acceptor)
MFNSLSTLAQLLAVVYAARVPYHTASKVSSNTTIANSSTTEWDYIVAGAGPAGIIVAERLAEQNNNVLLLDIGGPSIKATGGTSQPTWDADNMTVYDIPSQSPSVFATGATKFCGFVPSKAGCLLGGGVEVNVSIHSEVMAVLLLFEK